MKKITTINFCEVKFSIFVTQVIELCLLLKAQKKIASYREGFYFSSSEFRVRKVSFELKKRVSSKNSEFRVRKASFELKEKVSFDYTAAGISAVWRR